MAKRSARHLLEAMKSEPQIAATIKKETGEAVLKDISVAKAFGANLAELRNDFLKIAERKRIPDIVQMSELPVVTTCRIRTEGGKFAEFDETCVQMQKDAMEYGAQFIDIPMNAPTRTRDELIKAAIKNDTRIIISKHEQNMPSLQKMRETLERMHTLPHDIIKMVYTPKAPDDTLRLLEAAQSLRIHRKPYTVFGMGPYGKLSRVLSLFVGGSIAYCSIERNGRQDNLNQVSILDMKEIFSYIGGPENWKRIRRDPDWVRKDLAKAWASMSIDTYNNMPMLKRFIRDEAKEFLSGI
ncbi:MAG: type I 3-dehydroquinate dehydratase [Candidatus Micrarchaeota archaeon]|nr:type I 3-dehydroquinate dehydratase [Candidatus Micrarchaeota archaeon]